VTGVESSDGLEYRRTLRLMHGNAHVVLRSFTDSQGTAVACTLRLDAVADLQAAVQRCRRLLDLDADPTAIDAHLATDALLAPLVAARPGMRSPGAVDGTEVLVRAIVGQQVSVAGARTVLGRITALVGEECTHGALFPSAEALAGIDPASLPLPAARARAVVTACAAVADGRVRLDVGADRTVLEQELLALPGVGPWTAAYVAMRALGDPDVFLPTDLVLRRIMEANGVAAREVAARAAAFSPWRAYAVHHLWHAHSPVPKGPSHDR
jgi:AraC family transcriptional regulator of adaptative response / DNA-3-methyladenine glycosylase II